jgi:hypothetical protein
MGWLLRLIFVRILGRWALGLMALWGIAKAIRGSEERVHGESAATRSRSRGRTARGTR